MPAEDKAALNEAYAQLRTAEGIYSKCVSTEGGEIRVVGNRDQAKSELEKAKEILSQGNGTLERLGNKYDYQFGEGTHYGRIAKNINSALRELRQK